MAAAILAAQALVVTSDVESFGAALADGDPHVWRALLAAHAADRSGRCRTCRRASGPAETWPCRLWIAADRARARTQDCER